MTDRAVADGDDFGRAMVVLARSWIGTPYRHQASCRGAGADCLGLIRGLWREVYGQEPEVVPPYSPGWGELDGPETLFHAALRHFQLVDQACAAEGDVTLFRMIPLGPAKHLGLLARAEKGFDAVIHAYSGHSVLESPLTPSWQRRIVAVFRFPNRIL